MSKDVGWVQFPGISKAHYVVRSKSLCGRYGYWGRLYDRIRYGRESKCLECQRGYDRREVKRVFDPATDAWLAEFDWRKKQSGKDG